MDIQALDPLKRAQHHSQEQLCVPLALRGTQYYLRLTADAYPEVMAKAQVRFGYTIPGPPEDQS